MLNTIPVIDTDAHVSEPADLWTSRMSEKKWGDRIPRVIRDEDSGLDFWCLEGGGRAPYVGGPREGQEEFVHPYANLEVPVGAMTDAAAWDANLRLQWMDEHGIDAQVLYSNVALFHAGEMAGGDDGLGVELIKVYNDFQTEWASIAPKRLLPMTQLPFWDLEASLAELHRGAAMGHRGVVFSQEPANYGLPPLVDTYWDRLWAAAQEAGLPINFHIAAPPKKAESPDDVADSMSEQDLVGANGAKNDPLLHVADTVNFISGNIRTFSQLIAGGVCDRFPSLNFVGVESGIGWIPFFIESMNWQWRNNGVAMKRYELLPEEYFKRQIYGSFWFEEATARAAIDILGPDNFLYETDFPHPTCMCPGPGTIAVSPVDWLRDRWSDVSDDTLRKVLYANAARIYHLDH